MKKLRQHNGFTLIEVLVTMTILSIGFLGVAGLTTGVIKGNYFSKNVTTATVVAQSQLEDVQRAGYVNATTANFPSAAQNVAMGGVTFSRATSIDDNTPVANTRTITVTVTWEAGAKEVKLSTILAQ